MSKPEVDAVSWQEAGSGPPVLLIHGSGFDGSTWGSFYDELAQNHRVIAYNRRGYRDSGQPARKWVIHVDDAERLLRSLDAVPATIIGHSAGAIVATELAHRQPEIVTSLVLLDPAVYLRRNLTIDFVWTFVAAHAVRRVRGDQRGAERFYRWTTSNPDGSNAWDQGDFPRAWREVMLANAGAVFADMGAGDISLPRQALSNLRPPLALVQGELSPKLYHRVVRWLMGRIPGASRSVLPGAGHAMMLDRPLELAQLVRDAARTEIQR